MAGRRTLSNARHRARTPRLRTQPLRAADLAAACRVPDFAGFALSVRAVLGLAGLAVRAAMRTGLAGMPAAAARPRFALATWVERPLAAVFAAARFPAAWALVCLPYRRTIADECIGDDLNFGALTV